MRRAPAHAGGLKPWERLAFALAFALMAAFVAVVTISAVRAREHGGPPEAPASTSQTPQVGGAAPGSPPSHGTGGRPAPAPSEPSAAARDRQLAAALAPVLLHHAGHLAVGVIDRTTGARAVYDGRRRFAAGGIIRADILAVLLLRNQQAGTVFGEGELRLAAQMIETDDASAAAELWQDAGGPGGVAEANVALGLRHTTPGRGTDWPATSTTVLDQLRLLANLTSAKSPLTAASRGYELSLMRSVRAGQAWGVPAAADSSLAVQDGGLADPRLWAVSSVGVIRYAGQELLVAVLSDGQPTQRAGIAQDEAAAIAAVRQITASRVPGPVPGPGSAHAAGTRRRLMPG